MFGNARRYSEVTLPYAVATELVMPVVYNALNGKGEQRNIDKGHLRKLRKARGSGQYTPTPGSIGLRKKHREALAFETRPDGTEAFRLEVNSDDPLALTDAGHRMEALKAICKDLKDKVAKAKDEAE